MVYFLGDWGMGDTKCATCKHVTKLPHQQHNIHLQATSAQTLTSQTTSQTLSISRTTELIRQRSASIHQLHDEHPQHYSQQLDIDDEIALHPLSNQVSYIYIHIYIIYRLYMLISMNGRWASNQSLPPKGGPGRHICGICSQRIT